MTTRDGLDSVDRRIDALARCDRSVDVEAAFTPGDDYRPVIRLVLAAAEALEPTMSESRLEDLRLAVTEACSNAVKVHRLDALSEPVLVSGHVSDGEFSVSVRDRGPGFHPDDLAPLPDPDDPARLQYEHGLGVQLITELADRVGFEPVPGGTRVTISMAR